MLNKIVGMLASLLVCVGAYADLSTIIDTDLPQQKMVMGKAGLPDLDVAADDAPKQDTEKAVKKNTAERTDVFESKIRYKSSLVYDWAATVARESLSYSALHLARDQKMVSGYFSVDCWPKIKKALFDDGDALLQIVAKDRVDSSALLLGFPQLLNTEQWELGSVWVVRVPVAVKLHASRQKRLRVDVLLAISVDGGSLDNPNFLVQKALFQIKKDN